jgi:CubicO group peptidase (beta-lactamase class C family)
VDREARERAAARRAVRVPLDPHGRLAWCAVEATGTRFPDLFSRLVWSRIGAERDADIIVDEAGFPVVEGGICTTVPDLARFGLMHLEDGAAGGEQVVPADWIGRLLEPDDELIAAFDSDLLDHQAQPFYRDQWWVWDAEAGVYSGYGINGPQLLVHRPTRTVIARFSTWPERWDDRLSRYADVANGAVLERLGAVQRH